MTGVVLNAPRPTTKSDWRLRVWHALLAGWGALTGVLPHVLHHVGPLAGTALVAGAGGTVLFGGIGLAASVPFLVRLRRRFQSWVAPGVALALFVLMFALSTFVIGPWIRADAVELPDPAPSAVDEHGHPVAPTS